MRLEMKMTLDGLVRALRWQVHDLAEQVERGYDSSDRALIPGKPERRKQKPGRERGEGDDRAGR